MSAMLDTLRYANALKTAGVGAAQAEAMADALNAELSDQVATKGDIRELNGGIEGLQGDSAGLKGDVAVLKSCVEVLKGDVAGIKAEIHGLKYTTNIGMVVLALMIAVVGLLDHMP